MRTKTLIFIRLFFLTLFTFFATAFFTTHLSIDTLDITLFSLFFVFCLISFDVLLRKLSLKTFNIVILGLGFGYLMGLMLNFTLDNLIKATNFNLQPSFYALQRLGVQLFSIYIGMVLALRSSHEFQISIPYLKFSEIDDKKKNFLVDLSALLDPRLIDMASSGLFDNALVIPRFLTKEIQNMTEVEDESTSKKAKKAQEVIKKLEEISTLNLQYDETDFHDTHDITTKLIRLARLIDAHLITSDISRIQMSSIEQIRIINIHWLANALKPLMEAGEKMTIKIQRQGKEPNQGVGYLEDGTMVVVNGGGHLVGENIDVLVLSIKHTSSGRMIFCNTLEVHNEMQPA